jgi:hypothetical protein
MNFKRSISSGVVLLLINAIGILHAAEGDAYLKSIIGTVKVRKGESPTWKDGRPNMVLKEKDAVRTFVESQVEIMTSEGSVLRLDENTTLEMSTLKVFGGGAQTTKIKILNGTVLANVKKLVNTGSKFDFETPTAVASIRGTTVGFDVSSEKTLVKVYDGEVMVTPKGSQSGVSVKTNQMTAIIKGQKIIKPEVLTEREKNAVSSPDMKPAAIPADTTKSDTTQKPAAPVDTSAKKSAVDTVAKPPFPPRQGYADTTRTKFGTETVTLALVSPQDNVSVRPGTQITVSGKALPLGVKVNVAGKFVTPTVSGDFKIALTAPQAPGEYEIAVEASNGTQTKNMVRRYTVVTSTELFLNVTSPAEGQRLGQPLIQVKGTTAPGAEVTASGIKCQVAANGAFSGQVPIPDEETEMDLEVESTYNGKTVKMTRRIMYRSELSLVIVSPQNGQIVTTTSVQVSGQVLPSTAELVVYDQKIPLGGNGKFTGFIKIPDEEGSVDLTFEISAGGVTKNEKRSVTYKKPADIIRPEISPGYMEKLSKTRVLPFMVTDRTPDDEIVFYKSVDGARESESGRPNSSFNLDLEEGFHNYIIYAEDKNKNRSNTVAGTIGFLSRSLSIKMRKPIGSEVVHVPPGTPTGDFNPTYTVQFTILNVPDNDRMLIKQVTVTNMTTGKTEAQRDLLDLEMEFDIELKRGQNRLSVDVRDINDRIFSVKDLIVDVR